MAGKVWFVTGTSRGLGRAIVRAALQAGDRVVATARRPEQLAGLAVEHGRSVLVLPLDVTEGDAAASAAEAAVARFGRIDVLVNNAGYATLAAVEDVLGILLQLGVVTLPADHNRICRTGRSREQHQIPQRTERKPDHA
jgi:NAD(P)-dependent dehydrogenase (short-subunit alcohol dehydrogenase family)